MKKLLLREKEIFETLRRISKCKFVVIGGYAVNAYTLPRFSVDCDIVVENKTDLKKIEQKLEKFGYQEDKSKKADLPYHGNFTRYVKKIDQDFKVSMDILTKEIVDRQTNTSFSASWVFENSELRNLRGKTIPDTLKLRIINSEALVVMKFISCRVTDIRDVFMLLPSVNDSGWVKSEIIRLHDFNERFAKIKGKVTSASFKDNLQGVYGYVDEKVFEKHRKKVVGMR